MVRYGGVCFEPFSIEAGLEYAREDWNDMSSWFRQCGMPALISYVERSTELALEAKQAEQKKVPIVSVEWLKKWCKENKFGFRPPRVNIDTLLSAVEKEASKK